jgi:hypothetical protein
MSNIVKATPEDCEILNNQIRSFTVALIRFFIQNETCEWTMIQQQLNSMNRSIQHLLNSFETTRDEGLQRSFKRSFLEVEHHSVAPNELNELAAYQTFFEEVEENLHANRDHEELLDESSIQRNSIAVENTNQNSSVKLTKPQADIALAIEALRSAFEPKEFDEIQGYFNF